MRRDLERRIDAYFQETGLSRDGGSWMVAKSLSIMAWAILSYIVLVFVASTWWMVVPAAVSLGLAIACIGFSIQHDGNHGAYSSSSRLNALATWSLDLIGGSSFVWRQKHNVLHHTFTNVGDVDDDIHAWPFLRLAPHQRRLWFHRFQHMYFPVLLGLFFTSKWAVWDDFHVLATGRIGEQKVPRPRGKNLAVMLLGKALFFTWALAIPLMLHSVAVVLPVYLLTTAVLGITLGVVFQLAHAVDETDFPEPAADTNRLSRPFLEHQLATTANFAPKNRVITWYVGGLNFQVEHHMFPKISHRHYPALSPIVREVCHEHGVPYIMHETMSGAFRSHLRYLARLGASPVVAINAVPAA